MASSEFVKNLRFTPGGQSGVAPASTLIAVRSGGATGGTAEPANHDHESTTLLVIIVPWLWQMIRIRFPTVWVLRGKLNIPPVAKFIVPAFSA